MDFDVLSDISGISIEKEDDQLSGSIASDNTDILLNQNISFDGNDVSFGGNISPVEEQSPYRIRQNASMTNFYQTSDSSLHQTISDDFLTKPAKVPSTSFKSDTGSGSKTVSRYHTSDSQEEMPLWSNMNHLENETPYTMKKFPSDTNIARTPRQSVIKQHSSLPIINHEHGGTTDRDSVSLPILDDLKNDEEHKMERKNKKSQQVRFHPTTFVNETEPTKYNSIMLNNIKDWKGPVLNTHDGENGAVRVRQQPQFNDEFRKDDDKITSRDISLDSSRESQRSSEQKSGTSDLLLGVRHDPSTNELYDDKVREGADLLLRVLRDPNGSLTSTSSLSKESDKNETKLTSFNEENRCHSMQRSVVNSMSSDNSVRSKSVEYTMSPNGYGEPRSSVYGEPRSSVSANINMDFGKVDNEIDTRPSKDSLKWKQNGPMQGKFGVSLSNKVDDTNVGERQFEKGNDDYSTAYRGTSRKTLKIAAGSENSSTTVTELRDIDEQIQERMEKLDRLQLDVEEILSKKKMAVHELKVLEQTMELNKADMISSENLAEQYRWQATQARSELLELEKARDELRESQMLEASKKPRKDGGKEGMTTCSEEYEKELKELRETMKREKERAKKRQDDLNKKANDLEEQLRREHNENVANLHKVKEQLNKERLKLRTARHDKLNAINSLHLQMRETQRKENSALKTHLLREYQSNAEALEETFKRENSLLKNDVQTLQMNLDQHVKMLSEKSDELTKLRGQLRKEKQQNLDLEKKWRCQLESERQDIEIRADEQERSFKDKEDKHARHQTELENLLEERSADLRRCEERRKTQAEELQKIIENKNEEVKLVRGLVRQQEDATRALGERLRTEAREHVRNAVEKEREALNREKERVNKTLAEGREKNTKALKQLGEQLEVEKESHMQTKQLLSKLKHEAEELRKQVVEVHGERITSVQRVRQQGTEELGKIREKLHEFTTHAEKLEKLDRESAKAVYEECRKVAELVGMPGPFLTPTRVPDEKPSIEQSLELHQSPTKEALVSLRRYNDELRQKLVAVKQEMDKQRLEHAQMKKQPWKDDEVSKLKSALHQKNEEMQQLNKKHDEEIRKLENERKRDQLTYKKTVAKLEQEFYRQNSTNAVTRVSSTPKRDPLTPNTTNSTSIEATYKTPAGILSHGSQDANSSNSSSTDLLKHLQERVKKLRSENENLKKSSEKDSRHGEKSKGFSNAARLRRLLDNKDDSKALQTNAG